MQQTTILNGKAQKTLLVAGLTFAFMLFLNVSSSFAQNWIPAPEATLKAQTKASVLKNELASLPVGTLDYEKVVRRMQMYNNIATFLKSEPNVGIVVELAVSSAFSMTFSNPPNLQPTPVESREARIEATALLSN
jgi:hypothetical protein